MIPDLVRGAVLAMAVGVAVQEPATDPATLEFEAAWGPVESSTYRFMEHHAAVAEAMGAGPSTPNARHAVETLRALLPPSDARPDAVWEVDVATVLPLLAQLHPSVTGRLRHAHPPPDLEALLAAQGGKHQYLAPAVEGGRATLLSADEARLAVLLRVHVEFELIPGEMWFLPAQFEGHLEWDRAADRPLGFHLALPPRNTNWDINYKQSVDIGYLPLMQVATPGARAAGPEAEPARQRLREAFYPASRIQWRTLPDALARAKQNGRRLHVLQLFGTFDDESC